MCERSRAKQKLQLFSLHLLRFTYHFMTQTAFNYSLLQKAPFLCASWWTWYMCEVTKRFLLCPGAVVDKSRGKVLVVQDRNKVLCSTRLFIQIHLLFVHSLNIQCMMNKWRQVEKQPSSHCRSHMYKCVIIFLVRLSHQKELQLYSHMKLIFRWKEGYCTTTEHASLHMQALWRR